MLPTIACPTCRKPINMPEQFAGAVVNCPHCANALTVPHLHEFQKAPVMSPARGNDPFASLPVDEPDVPRRNSAKAARDNSGMLVLIVLVMVSCGVGGGLLYYHHFSQRAAIESKAGLSREEYERLANHVADAEETIKRFEKLRREEAMLDEQLYNKLSKKISDMRLDLLRSKDKMAELKSTPGF